MLLAVTATNSYHVDSSLLLRQHYGIVFKPRETFRPIIGHWLHSFGFSLPAYPPVTAEARQLDCQHVSEANRTHCLRMKPYIDSLGLIQRNMSNALRDMMRGIDGIIPERPIPRRRTRVSRSWIPVLGNILHTVAGTATTEKVRKALTAVDEMRRTQAVALNQWAKAEGDIASLTQVVDERMNALQRLVTDEWQSKVRQYHMLSATIDDVLSISSLVPTLIQRTAQFSSVMVHTEQLRLALLDAINGRLNTFLINHDHMYIARMQIGLELRKINPRLSLALTNTGDAYQLHDFVISRQRRDVFITVKFPVTWMEQVFTLYDVITYAVTMPDDSQHSTRLDTDVTAFAFEPTADYYLEFSSMPTVHNRMLYLSNVRERLRHASAYSCIFALFRNSAEYIHDLCSFVLLPHSLAPSVLAFDASTVLFTNVTNVTRTWPGQR